MNVTALLPLACPHFSDRIARAPPQRIANDSALGRWQLWTLTPQAPLAGAVQMLWALDGEDAYTRERLLPRDTIELLINLGEPHRLLPRPGAEGRLQRVLDLRASRLVARHRIPPNAKLIGVRFLPGGCHRVFGLAADTLFGRVVDLDDVVGPIAREWRARLLEAPDMETRLSRLEAWMTERLVSVDRALHGAVALALHELGRSHGCMPIRAVAEEAGVSHKHLIDLFGPRSDSRPRRSRACCDSRRCCGTCTPEVNRGRAARTGSASSIKRTSTSSSAPLRDTRHEFLRARGPDGDSIVLDRAPDVRAK